MQRPYNFGAGPAMLPEPVLLKAQAELLDWQGTGMSVMEVGHRTPLVKQLMSSTEKKLRNLLSIPESYAVLFLTGSASSQFSAVPMNLLGTRSSADYLDTGVWSKKAIAEAKRYTHVNVIALEETDMASWQLNPEAAYFHYTSNETIEGLFFEELPNTGDVPVAVDMTSDILSRPIDVSRYGVIYAGAQKNIAHAGMAITIIRRSLLGQALAFTPTLLNYDVQAKASSAYNTSPVFAIYMAGLMLDWVTEQGGVSVLHKRNQEKAKCVYESLEKSDGFYRSSVNPRYRSLMNIPFNLPTEALTEQFLHEAEAFGLLNLKGHRLVGGVRASMYNAMPLSGAEKLCSFMEEFCKKNQ